MKYFDEIKVEDRVWEFMYGWGTVTSIDASNQELLVHFDCAVLKGFTFDGLVRHSANNQTLFWDEIRFEVPGKPRPKLAVDAKVLVKQKEDDEWVNRYFSHWDPSGRIACFDSGTTSWTADTNPSTRTSLWKYWKILKDKVC